MQIKKTKNYSKFTLLPENRPINLKRVVAMEQHCIENDLNFLNVNPILVNPKIVRDKLAIIDGQHRFELAKRLTEPVYYIESEEIQSENIIGLNTYAKNWTIPEYLNFYSVKGIKDYVKLKEIWDAIPDIAVTALLEVFGVGDGKQFVRFKAGEFKIENYASGNRILQILEDFRFVKFWNNTRFVRAVVKMAHNPEYDHEIMKKKLEYLSGKVVKSADTIGYLRMFQEIYNFKQKNRIRLITDVL